MRRVRMTRDHAPPAGPVLRLRAGEVVEVGARDDDWPSWVRCTAADGTAGWVPEHYLAREAPEFEQATVLHDYEATELAVPAGEALDVVREEEGWLWCRTETGALGWVPEGSTESG
jgi:hypothetical protein